MRLAFKWLDEASTASNADDEELVQTLQGRDVAEQQPGSTTRMSLLIADTVAALDHELEVTVSYRLQSDPDSVLEKTLVLDVAVIRPFEANYDFLPRLLREAWPSFFSIPEGAATSSTPLGLKTAIFWSLLVSSPLQANLLSLRPYCSPLPALQAGRSQRLVPVSSRDAPVSTSAAEATISAEIQPETTRSFDFDLSVQKHVLGDRHTVALDLFTTDWLASSRLRQSQYLDPRSPAVRHTNG